MIYNPYNKSSLHGDGCFSLVQLIDCSNFLSVRLNISAVILVLLLLNQTRITSSPSPSSSSSSPRAIHSSVIDFIALDVANKNEDDIWQQKICAYMYSAEMLGNSCLAIEASAPTLAKLQLHLLEQLVQHLQELQAHSSLVSQASEQLSSIGSVE